MNLETKITIYKFTPQVFTLPRNGVNGNYKKYYQSSIQVQMIKKKVISIFYLKYE